MRISEIIQEATQVSQVDDPAFKARCEAIVKRIAQAAGTYDSQIINRVQVWVTSDPKATSTMFSSPRDLVVVVDAYEFKNAPDNTLMWLIGHELGHIVMMHTSGQTPQASQQQELDADTYINQLLKKLGVNRAEAFAWMGQRRDQIQRLEQNKRFERDPANRATMQNHSHPSMDQRIRQAKDQGFDLSQTNTDQLDQALQQA